MLSCPNFRRRATARQTECDELDVRGSERSGRASLARALALYGTERRWLSQHSRVTGAAASYTTGALELASAAESPGSAATRRALQAKSLAARRSVRAG